MTILPAPVTVSVLPEMVPVPMLVESMEKVTWFPEAPPVATNATVRPGVYVAAAGWVKLMVCVA